MITNVNTVIKLLVIKQAIPSTFNSKKHFVNVLNLDI